MRSIDTPPKVGSIVIAYCATGHWYPARYRKVLSWTGYKMKYVNLLSKAGLWHDDIVGWNRLPTEEETL